MSTAEAAVISRLEALRKAGKSAEADKVLTSVLSELEKIPINPHLKMKLGTKFDRDFSKEGYDLEEDVEPLEGDIEFDVLPTKNRESNGKLGQRDAENVLKFLNSEEGREASKELRPYYLVFTGTVWVNRDSRQRYVVCLYWDGKRWYLDLNDLDYDWDGHVRVLSPRKNP